MAVNAGAVFITPQVIADMSREVLNHPHEETAWGIYGLKLASGDIIITGVLFPSGSDIVRGFATASFGGARAVAEITWLHDNWDLMSSLGLNPEGAEFMFLYKGHSHQHLQFARYSGTDTQSIIEAVRDDGMEVAIGPLAVCNVPDPVVKSLRRREGITFATSQYVRFLFYYYSRAMLDDGQTRPIVIQPRLIDTTDVPVMPPKGWQFARDADFERELEQLRSYGCTVIANYREIEGGPPFEIHLTVTRPTWSNYLFITTFWNHPATEPKFQIVPNGAAKEESRHFDGVATLADDQVWNPRQSLLEAVFRLEARHQL